MKAAFRGAYASAASGRARERSTNVEVPAGPITGLCSVPVFYWEGTRPWWFFPPRAWCPPGCPPSNSSLLHSRSLCASALSLGVRFCANIFLRVPRGRATLYDSIKGSDSRNAEKWGGHVHEIQRNVVDGSGELRRWIRAQPTAHSGELGRGTSPMVILVGVGTNHPGRIGG